MTFWASGVGANSGAGDSDIYRDSLTIFNDTFLPVELAGFDGIAEGSDVILSWWTASETDNMGFDVQWRNSDSERFETVGFVAGAGTTTEREDYTYRLDDVGPGRHLFRLRQVDFDGTVTVSEQIEIAIDTPERFELSSAYPNPFNPSTTFRLTVDRSQDVVITAVDPLGRTVGLLFDGWVTEHEPVEIRFDASDLSTGLYVVRAQGMNFSASRTVMLVR